MYSDSRIMGKSLGPKLRQCQCSELSSVITVTYIATLILGSLLTYKKRSSALVNPLQVKFHCMMTGMRWRQVMINSFNFFHIQSSVVPDLIHNENRT